MAQSRRHFLRALVALPFVAKALPALASSQASVIQGWRAPRTWGATESLTAAQMNACVLESDLEMFLTRNGSDDVQRFVAAEKSGPSEVKRIIEAFDRHSAHPVPRGAA